MPSPALPPMSRHAYYASLPRAKRADQPHWTVESILIAYGLFVREEGTTPVTVDCHTHNAMPALETIARLVPGGLTRLHTVYAERYGAVEPAPSSPRAADVVCLSCGQTWHSPDKTLFRLCPRCREAAAQDDDDGAWMNGTPVLADGPCDWCDTEEL